MKKLLPLACLTVVGAVASCTPDIDDTSPAPTGQVIAEFDPAHNIIPTPNDIIPKVDGHLAIPDQEGDSDTQKEFNAEYLNTLDNFPAGSSASMAFSAELDPATVNAKTVIAVDITTLKPVAIAPVYANKHISIPPPAGGWTRAHQYAILTVGGASGLKGVNGETVVGSTTWALVSGTQQIVKCTDQAALTGCTVALDVIPGTGASLQEQYDSQLKNAVQLEQIRSQYDRLLAQSSALGVNRDDIPLAFTFTIADAGEMTFDPANSVIPFPNDVLRTNGTITLPNPKTGKPPTAAECAAATETSVLLVCGLNTLDGFSTLTPPVSENSTTEGALRGGEIDGKSLSTTSVGLVPLASTGHKELATAPNYTPCLNCVSSADATTMMVPTSPQQLQWKLNAPLDEKTTYFGYVTSAVKDTVGKSVIPSPTFALLRLTKPLVDETGKSQVSVLTDAQATQLEPLRAAFAPVFAGLEAKGLPRLGITLAFPFTTQSEGSVLDQLYGAPTLAGASGLIDYPVGVLDQTAAFNASGAPHDHIAKWFAGQFYSIVAVTNPAGTFNPGLMGAKPQPINFVMSIPTGTPPAGGWPVTIWGHGINGDKTSFAAVANTFATAGQIVIAPDVLFHGDRTTCTGSKAVLPAGATDDAACADPTTQKCDEGTYSSTTNFGQGLCVLRDTSATARPACAPSAADPLGDGVCAALSATAGGNLGRCAADGKCQGIGADFLRAGPGQKPVISGWNLFSLTNFFATRDNFRSQVIDLAQLVRVLKSTDMKKLGNQLAALNGGVPVALDATKLSYTGQSLGGIQGTLFNAVSPDTTNVVLNVPGGNLTSIILNAPAFAAQKTALLAVLAGQGLTPGHADFDQFIGFATWILDPADPANLGYRLTHPVDLGGGVSAPPAGRKAFIQFIEGDQTVPNVSNFALVAGANRTFNPAAPPSFGCTAPLFCYEFTASGDSLSDTSAPPAKRHSFLTTPVSADAFGLALTGKAQVQAATFVTTGNFQ